MMPLSYANAGEENVVRRIGGPTEVQRHLADMGFNPGETVTVISTLGGNIIVKVKETRVAISAELAAKIMI